MMLPIFPVFTTVYYWTSVLNDKLTAILTSLRLLLTCANTAMGSLEDLLQRWQAPLIIEERTSDH